MFLTDIDAFENCLLTMMNQTIATFILFEEHKKIYRNMKGVD